jgi:hypothetical protein
MLSVTRGLLPAAGVAALIITGASAQTRQPSAVVQGVPSALMLVPIHAIAAPTRPLPAETESAGVSQFSFIAYGDTRNGNAAGPGEPPSPGDGDVVHPIHTQVVNAMLARIEELKSTAFPVRFVVQSGDSVQRGANGVQWNVSFSPVIERLTQLGGVPYFFSAGNHDVSGMPPGDPGRGMGLHNALSAMSQLIPPEGSPRRLNGYPTYSVGFGNTFLIALDSNIATDQLQLAWVANQLEHLDRQRYRHVVAVFHHSPFSSGPHGGPNHVEPQSQAIRDLYMPLFRHHGVALVIAGHDHLFDHFVEHYEQGGTTRRIDAVVTGGGGAPLYSYSGEPELAAYLAAGASQRVHVEHLVKPSPVADDNPHHFVVVTVDGDRLSLEVVSIGAAPYRPYNGSARIQLSRRVS